MNTGLPPEISFELPQRCNADDPDRCQAVTSHGQCFGRAVPGTDRCAFHGGTAIARRNGKTEYIRYKLGAYQARVNELNTDPEFRDISSEISILRMLVEEIMNSCNQPIDLIINSKRIQDIIAEIKNCVLVLDRIDERNRNFMDRHQVAELMGSIVEVVSMYVAPEVLKNIVEDLRALQEGKRPVQIFHEPEQQS